MTSSSDGPAIRFRWGLVTGILFLVSLFSCLYGAFVFWNWPWVYQNGFVNNSSDVSSWTNLKDVAVACFTVVIIPLLGIILGFWLGWVYKPYALYWFLLVISFLESLVVLSVGSYIIHQGRSRLSAWQSMSPAQWKSLDFGSKDFFQHAFGQLCCGYDRNDGLAYTGTNFNLNHLNDAASQCPSSSTAFPGCHELGAQFFFRELVIFGALFLSLGFLFTFGATVVVYSSRYLDLMALYEEDISPSEDLDVIDDAGTKHHSVKQFDVTAV